MIQGYGAVVNSPKCPLDMSKVVHAWRVVVSAFENGDSCRLRRVHTVGGAPPNDQGDGVADGRAEIEDAVVLKRHWMGAVSRSKR